MQAITNTWFVRLFCRLVLTCLAVAGISGLAYGQCSDGTCKLYIDGEAATFKYSIFGKKVGNIGDAKFFKDNSEFDFSGQGIDAVLTVRLEQLDRKRTDMRSVKVKPSEIRISKKEDFQLVDASGVLNAGSDDRIDIKFKLLRSANENSRGEIVIPVAFRHSNNASYLDATPRLKIRYTGLKLDAAPAAQSESDSTSREENFWNSSHAQAIKEKNRNINNAWDKQIVAYLKEYPNGTYKEEALSLLRKFCQYKLLGSDRTKKQIQRSINAFNGSRPDRCDCSNEQELGINYIKQAQQGIAELSGEKPAEEKVLDGAETKSAAAATEPDCNRALRIASASGSSCKDLLKVVSDYQTCNTAVKTARDRYNSIQKNDKSLLQQLSEDLGRAKTEAEKLHAYQDYLNGVGRKGTCNREKRQEAEAKVRAISAAIGAFAVHAKDEGGGELFAEIINASVDKIDDLEITIQKDGKKLEEGRDIYKKAAVEKDGDKITFRLKDLDQGIYTVTVYNNPKGLSSEALVVIDGADPGVKVLATDSTSIRFIVKGGVPPYHLYFRKKGETGWLESNSFDLTKAENPHQRIFEVGYSRLASLNAEKGDDIELYIQDKGSLLGEDKAFSFVFGERNTSSWWKEYQTEIVIAVILTLVLAIIWLLFLFVVKPWIKKNKTNQLALTLASFLGINLADSKEEKAERLRKEKATPKAAEGAVAAAALGAGAHDPKADKRIKINLKKGKEVAVGEPRKRVKVASPAIKYPVELETLKDDRTFYHVDLFKLWGDSAVKDIYIGKVCAAGINMIVQKELDERELVGEADSEIGGFILGRYGQHTDGAYYISFDQFVSAKGERGEDDPYEVELDMTALDDPLRKSPDLTLIGWFHTHPGHSLFLSGKDIDVQKRVFNAPYQVAMEIDPYTKNFDMGFFTWQKDNRKMNESAKDRLAGVDGWPSWSEVNSWRRFLKMGR